jgi:hypothetical protein
MPGGGDHALDVPQLLVSALQNPVGPDYSALTAVGVGVIVTAVLMVLKLSLVGWPLHPVALPIACAWVTDEYLPAIFTAWVIKAVIMRYGGLRLHRHGLTFFLGVIVGSAITTFLRTLLAWVLDVRLLY